MKEQLEFVDFAFTLPTFIFGWIFVDFKSKWVINVGVVVL